MNSKAAPKFSKTRPVDWAVWVIWIILFVGIGVSTYMIRKRGLDQTIAWVALQDLPTYHLITDTDVMTTTITLSDLPDDALSVENSPSNYYTFMPIKANQVLKRGDLVATNDQALTLDTVPLSIPATAAATFNGQLTSGSLVTVWAIYPADKSGINKTELLLQRVLVLDVLKTENSRIQPYVVILAVPVDRQAIVWEAASSGSLYFALVP